MNAGIDGTKADIEVHEVLNSWTLAVRALDIDEIIAHYDPDILAFDAVSQLQFKGVDAYRRHWESCMSMCPGPMIFEIHELRIMSRATTWLSATA